MGTMDHMIIDNKDLANKYFSNSTFDEFSDEFRYEKRGQKSNNNSNNNYLTVNKDDGSYAQNGRRVYLESPSLAKEEEDMYRYVPSRLSEVPPATETGENLIDSLDFELDLMGANNNVQIPMQYRTKTQVPKQPDLLTQFPSTLTRSPTSRRPNPRQDPLLGPLLAELDALSSQQQSIYKNPQVYENSLNNGFQSTFSTTQTRGVHPTRNATDGVVEQELYDSLDQNHQHYPKSTPFPAPNLNSKPVNIDNLARQEPPPPPPQQQQRIPYLDNNNYVYQPQQNFSSNMNGTDIFMPSSFSTSSNYNSDPFLSNFGTTVNFGNIGGVSTDDQRSTRNQIGQNHMTRRPPQQDPSLFDQNPHERMSSPNFTNSNEPRRHHNGMLPNINVLPQQQQQHDPRMAYRQPTNENVDPFSEYHEMFTEKQSMGYTQPPPRIPLNQQQPLGPIERNNPPVNQIHSRHHQQQQPRPPNSNDMFFTDSNGGDDQDFMNNTHPPPQQQHQQQQQQQHQQQQHQQQQQQQHQQQQHQQHQQQQRYSNEPVTARTQDNTQNDQQRQAIWDELQKTNQKVQEKNAKKRESANKRNEFRKGYSNVGGSGVRQAPSYNSQQSSAQSKTSPTNNYIEQNIDMIKNKENFFYRYPAKKYENLYSKRKDLAGIGDNEQLSNRNRLASDPPHHKNQTNGENRNAVATYNNSQHRPSLPITINLNPNDNPNNKMQSGKLPASVTIPLDSSVKRDGDHISVNIDLRLVDLQNLKQSTDQQQYSQKPDWSGLDPLDRHIRKLEESIDKSLPATNPSLNRSSTIPGTSGNFASRSMKNNDFSYSKHNGGYSPPNGYYNYSDKGKEEDSYLAKMQHLHKKNGFKAYTVRDYQQFKKNFGFGSGYLGFDFDNSSYKEKSDKMNKTKEYAQQIEERNKKKLADAPRRTLSDTRSPTEASKTQRALAYARLATRHVKPANSGISTHSSPSPVTVSDERRRPTDIPLPPKKVKQFRFTQQETNDDDQFIERLALRHDQEKQKVQGILNSNKNTKRVFLNDDINNDIERLAQDRAEQRRSPQRHPPQQQQQIPTNRKPVRLDKPLLLDSNNPRYVDSSQQQIRIHNNYDDDIDQLAVRHNDEKVLMDAIRQELSERPLDENEELIIVEQ